MMSIGETLRGERVRRHLDIQGISRELKIPAKFLEAIEAEQFEKLPAAVFARSFLRQYVRYLGLPEEDLLNALQHVLEPPPSMSEPASEKSEAPVIQMDRMAEWESVGERRSWSSSLPALALVVVAMLGCSGVYAWWQRSRHSVSAHEQTQATQATAGQEIPSATLAAARPAPPPNTAQPASAQPAPPAQAERAAVPPPVSASPAAAQSAGQAVPMAAASSPPGPVHVEVTANALVWVLAKADDKTSFSGTLEPSQSRSIDAQRTVVLRLGNAGGADITLNGKPIGPVGPKGQPRTIQLTSGGFQIVASPSPPALLDPLVPLR